MHTFSCHKYCNELMKNKVKHNYKATITIRIKVFQERVNFLTSRDFNS